MEIYSVADNIISPLGFDTSQNFNQAMNSLSGISLIEDDVLSPTPFYGAKIYGLERISGYTKLESVFIKSIENTLAQVKEFDKSRTVLVLSSTKGNIDLLNEEVAKSFPEGRLEMHKMAQAVSHYFDLPYTPIVVSNACISGVSAILVAKNMISSGYYDHAIVTGGDLLSEFTISGFQCLKAMSDEPCKPYDNERKGINLGEACGTMFITKNDSLGESKVLIKGGAQTNDANHISGPSRTGEGLKLAVEKALHEAKLIKSDIDYINAHGTATMFNDEMEAIAFDRLGLHEVLLNSLKGYFGHTLGAAGIIESIMAVQQLNEGQVLPSKGFTELGVSKPINVNQSLLKLDKSAFALKTVSGFGGCNAAIIFARI